MKEIATIVLGMVLLTAGWGDSAAAAPSGPDPVGSPGRIAGEAGDALAQGPGLSPMMAEIRALLAGARLAESGIRARLAEAPDGESAERVDAELADHELALRIRILEIQARHVRAEGRHELARLIETRLGEMRAKRLPEAWTASAH